MNKMLWATAATLVTVVAILAIWLVLLSVPNKCGDKSTLIYEGQVYCVEASIDEGRPDEYHFYIEPAFTEHQL